MEFDVGKYFGALQTTRLGRVLLYTPVITSTQTVFTGNTTFTFASCESGVICSAGQQTRGKGQLVS